MITINGLPILTGNIRLPRVGVGMAELQVDTQNAVQGPCTIATDDGSFTFKGQAFRSGIFTGTLSLRVILGGA